MFHAFRGAQRLILALALGLMTTVGVCWAAMFLPLWGAQKWYGPPATEHLGVARSPSPGAFKTFQITRGRNPWHTVTSYWWMQISGQSLTMTSDDPAYREVDLASLPAHMRPKSIDDLVMLSWYHQTGWPMPAMTCAVHWKTQILNSNIIYRVEGGIQLPRDAEFNPRALPLRPLWPGFVVNTLAAAAAWWLALWAVATVRRSWRKRHNRCVRCGYSQRGLAAGAACPECGCEPSRISRSSLSAP